MKVWKNHGLIKDQAKKKCLATSGFNKNMRTLSTNFFVVNKT